MLTVSAMFPAHNAGETAMAPFFLDVWMEAATQNQQAAMVKAEKKTLFFIPSNDDIRTSAVQKTDQSASEA
jgi:hypothetical protein